MCMDIIMQFLSPLMVGLFMFVYTRKQAKRDKEKEAHEKAVKQLNQIIIKGVVISAESSTVMLTAIKKLKDENGKPLLNGEVRTASDKVLKFKEELQEYLIEK